MADVKTVLFFRPNYELATKYLSAYAGRIVDEAVSLGYNVVDLYGVDATKEKFEEALTLHDPFIVGLFGHGNYNLLVGQDNVEVLRACTNDQILGEREVLALSCRTGATLGPSARDKTCAAYYGWQEDFTFWVDESVENPLEDPYAAPFFESGLTPMHILLNGGSLFDAYDKTVETFNSWIAYWRASADPLAPEIITQLYWDRDNFILLTKAGMYTPIRRLSLSSSLLVIGMVALPLFLKAGQT